METNSNAPVEETDRYILPLAGRCVSRCFLDYAFGLCFYEEGPSTEIRIEGKLRLLEDGQERARVDPGPGSGPDPRTLGPMLILFRKTVVSAYAFKTGELRILFDRDLTLEVEAGEKYEPWEMSANNGLKLVSLPGGSLAYWAPLR